MNKDEKNKKPKMDDITKEEYVVDWIYDIGELIKKIVNR